MLAAEELERATLDEGLSIAMLEALLPALRARALHSWALSLGCPPAALSHRHVTALDALVTAWHGQGAVHLPGGIRAARVSGVLRVLPSDQQRAWQGRARQGPARSPAGAAIRTTADPGTALFPEC